VKVPVVISKPFSPLPAIAPRKSLTAPAETLPLYLLHWKNVGKLTNDSLYTPMPSMPPSPVRPVTVTFRKPASRRRRCTSLSKAAGPSEGDGSSGRPSRGVRLRCPVACPGDLPSLAFAYEPPLFRPSKPWPPPRLRQLTWFGPAR